MHLRKTILKKMHELSQKLTTFSVISNARIHNQNQEENYQTQIHDVDLIAIKTVEIYLLRIEEKTSAFFFCNQSLNKIL